MSYRSFLTGISPAPTVDESGVLVSIQAEYSDVNRHSRYELAHLGLRDLQKIHGGRPALMEAVGRGQKYYNELDRELPRGLRKSDQYLVMDTTFWTSAPQQLRGSATEPDACYFISPGIRQPVRSGGRSWRAGRNYLLDYLGDAFNARIIKETWLPQSSIEGSAVISWSELLDMATSVQRKPRGKALEEDVMGPDPHAIDERVVMLLAACVYYIKECVDVRMSPTKEREAQRRIEQNLSMYI